MRKEIIKKQSGYTIIETMIAVSLFLIIVVAGIGALLNANLLHQKSRDMRDIMDNLSFVMEDMSRNIRMGYSYHCIDDGDIVKNNVHSCPTGKGISFKSSIDNSQWVYYVGVNNNGLGIFRKVNGGVAVQLTPDEVSIVGDDPSSGLPVSSFSVLGAEPPRPNGDKQQPFVIIKLVGKITTKGVVTPFSLQTSVSQRLIDN